MATLRSMLSALMRRTQGTPVPAPLPVREPRSGRYPCARTSAGRTLAPVRGGFHSTGRVVVGVGA